MTDMHSLRDVFSRVVKNDKAVFWIILGTLGLLFFGFLPFRALWDPGEGRYAEIAREMLESGNYLVPTLDYVPYFEKPPLAYWLNAFSLHIFGINEFAVRFFTALSGLLTVWGSWFFASRVFSRRAGLLAMVISGTSLGVFAYSQIPELDMLLTCFFCWGLWLFWLGFEKRVRPALYINLSYVMIALGCLVKGPVSPVLWGLIVGAYILLTGQLNRWRDLYLSVGIPLFLLVAAPWFIAISVHEPEFFRFFFIREHFERFTSTEHQRKGSPLYFVPVLIIGMFPWIISVFHALLKAWNDFRAEGMEKAKPYIYIGIWSAVVFGFFSVSGSKRPPYILLIFPPLATLAGWYWDSVWDSSESRFKTDIIPLVVFFILVCAGLLVAPQYIRYISAGVVAAWIPAAILAVACVDMLVSRNRRAGALFISLSVYTVLFAGAAYSMVSGYDMLLSRKAIASVIKSEMAPGEKVFSYHADYDKNCQSLSFYLGMPVGIIGDRGELETGAGISPRAEEIFPDDEKFFRIFDGPDRIFVVTKKANVKYLQGRVVARVYCGPVLPGELIAVSNRPMKKEI